MKPVKVILTTGILLATTAAALALPPARSTAPALRSATAFEDVKAGDKLALVCKECESVTVLDVTTKEDAMKLCTEGETVACGSCKKTFKVVAHGPRGKGGKHTETRIVNDKGEECMFVTKLPN
jgi:hypothetical protein